MTTTRPPAKPKLKEGETPQEKPTIPLWKQPKLAMETPMVLPSGLTKEELKARLTRMKEYRIWAKGHCPKMVVSDPELRLWLVRSQYNPELAKEVVKD